MSRKSRQEQLHKRLKSLLADLLIEQGPDIPAITQDTVNTGWTWQCDQDGVYLQCSPEVLNVVGYAAEEVVGHQLRDFGLSARSREELKAALGQETEAFELPVRFRRADGIEIDISVNVFPEMGSDGKRKGWRGFMQVQKELAEIYPRDGKSSMEEASALEMQKVETDADGPNKEEIDEMGERIVAMLELEEPISPDGEDEPQAEMPEKGEPARVEPVAPSAGGEIGSENAGLEMELNGRPSKASESELRAAELTQPTLDSGTATPGFEKENEPVRSVRPSSISSPTLAFQETASLDPNALSEHAIRQIRSGKRALPEFLEPSTQDLLDAIDSDPEREWTDEELLLVEQVTDQLALALENARLFKQTEVALAETDEQAKRLSLLNQLGDQLSQAGGLEEIYALSVMKAQEIFGSNHASVSVLNSQADKLLIEAEIDNRGFISKGREIQVEDSPYRFALIENRIFINPEIIDPNLGGVRSFMVGPLIVGGEVVGAMTIGSFQTNAFSRVDSDFLQQMISLVGSMVDNRRLFNAVQSALSESEEQGRRLKLLNEMGELFTQASTLHEIAKIASAKTLEIFRSQHADMLLVNAAEEQFEVLAEAGETEQADLAGAAGWEAGLGKVVRTKQIAIEEAGTDAEGTVLRSKMTAPILVGGEVIGTVSVSMERDYLFTSTDQNMLSQITSFLAGTLENTRLFTQIQRRSTQLQAAANVSRMAGGILDSAELLQNLVEAIREGFDLYYAGIFLVDANGEWTGEPEKWAVLQAGTGSAGSQMLIAGHKLEIGGESMIGSCIASGQARIALDVGKEAVFFRNPYLPDTRSEMALPLISRGSVIGALTIQSPREAAFTAEDVTALQTMADQVANSIENVNLYEQAQKRATELSVLNEMASTFTQTLDTDTIYDHILQYTSRLMDARNFYIAIYDKEKDEIHLPIFKFRGAAHEDQGIRLQSGNGITEWIIKNRKAVLLRENAAEWIREHQLEMRGFDAQSWLGVPMMRGNEVIGVIAVQSYSAARKYSQQDLELLSAVASQAGIAIENARLFQQTQARAQREQERATQERLVRTITERMRSGQDIPTILKITLDELEKAFGVNVSMIKLADRDRLGQETDHPSIDGVTATAKSRENGS